MADLLIKRTAKEHEDVEAIMRKKFLAKFRFRSLVRRVIANLHWLIEDEEVYEGDNVKKRVEQAMRAKKQKLLSLTDKALLNKPVSERTDAEKRYIYRKIGGLKCFKRYPNHVKKKLAAATYFRYYGPNRVVVRQHQEAEALYFVVTGEVVVSVLIYDELLKKNMSINVFVMHSGDMFGEVSLLHNINRTATCTTSGHCEFLALMKQDFKNVLQKSLQKQWDEVTQAMNSFTYFNGLDEVARREGCIVAKMRSFEPNEIILGDGAGLPNFVYFVLSGSCQMIESLHITCTEILGKKHYSLDDSPDTPAQKKVSFQLTKPSKLHSKSMQGSSPVLTEPNKESKANHNDSNAEDEKSGNVEESKLNQKESTSEQMRSSKDSGREETDEPNEISSMLLQFDKEKGHDKRKSSIRSIVPPPQGQTSRTYFMQVCIFNAGSTFGFGENMADRRIVATTRVDCMMLPLTWLMQKNTANIWSRIRHYLDKKIPTKKQLFQHFVSQRRWLEWRDSQVEEIVARSKTVNYTTVHDVPYSIRMKETPDI